MNLKQSVVIRGAVTPLSCALLNGAVVFATAPSCRSSGADQIVREGKNEEARTALKRTDASQQENADAHFHLGLLARERGDYEEAANQLETANALAPNNSDYVFQLGVVYGYQADRAHGLSIFTLAQKAKAHYDRAIALDPDNLAAREARCQYCRRAPAIAGGGIAAAYAEAEAIRQRDSVRGAQALAEVYIADDKPDEAMALAAKTAANPNRKQLLIWYGMLAARTGRQLEAGETALKTYLSSAAAPGETKFDEVAHWRLGQIYERRDNKAMARAEYEMALTLFPNFSAAKEALQRLR